MKEPMETITFTKEQTVLNHKGEVEQHFVVGEVAELRRSSARRWRRRQVAVEGRIAPPSGEVVTDDEAEPSGDGQGGADEENTTEFVRPFTAVHQGFGNWDVVDANGAVVHTKQKKAQAKLLAAGN